MSKSLSRRNVFTAGAVGVAGAALPLMAERAAAADPALP